MSIASNSNSLKRRVDDYVWRDRSMPLVLLRQLLREHFSVFPRVAIIGGLVRDIARKGAGGFRSDVDLVIEAPSREVMAVARKLAAKPNRFGGFGYNHPNWKIDFWALESTWAATSGHVSVAQMSDLTDCTFFNFDAVLYDLTARAILCHDEYFNQLHRGELEVNLLPTPSVQGNLLRSVRRLLFWNVQARPRLTDFIVEHLSVENFHAIRATERSLYPSPILARFRDPTELAHYLFDADRRVQLGSSFAIQLQLPGL
jgi:hypothetical protein